MSLQFYKVSSCIGYMKASTFQFSFVKGSIVLFSLLASIPVGAEIIPDNTLPNNSVVTPAEENTTRIQEGTERGGNLFHSFEEFSVESGNTARFEHDSGIENIITRVRGSASNINGAIQTLINGTTDKGSANLFILNPNGIIFGENASLDIGGSFIGSTADSIKFADGTEFSAINPQNSALLTISVPLGLQFGSNPAEIVNRSNGDGELNIADLPIGLQIPNGKTLALVGGNLILENSGLTAREGRIELGSIAENSLVSLNKIETGYALGYAGVQNFGDIILQQASVDASGEGGGAIQVQGKNINITDLSIIFADTEGSTPGKNLEINASESLKLSGGAQIATFALGEAPSGDVIVKASDSIELDSNSNDISTGFFAQVLEGTGNGGNVIVETRLLTIQNGARISTSTFDAGNAGNVIVKATDGIKLVGRTPNFRNPSGILAQVGDEAVENVGDAGNITIETRQLTLEAGAQISSLGASSGNGGSVTISASDLITLTGSSPNATLDSGSSGIFASAQGEAASGNPGQLNIATGLLTVENGGKISANNRSTGQQPGNLTLEVDNLVIRDGGLVQAGTFNTGPGGDLTVNAKDSVEVSGTGILGQDIPVTSNITVSSEGTGAAGNLEITANRVELDNQGELKSESQADADAGDISLNLNESLFLRRGSQISTSAGTESAPGDGGNIFIDAPNGFIVAIPDENSDITANAFTGAGGEVDILTQGIFGITFQEKPRVGKSDITASSEFGVMGNVNISILEVDPAKGLIELPSLLVDASNQISNACNSGSGDENTFVSTGRGGLPINPTEPLQESNTLSSWVRLKPQPENAVSRINQFSPRAVSNNKVRGKNQIVEATGWIVDKDGNIEFVAQANQSNPKNPLHPTVSCAESQ